MFTAPSLGVMAAEKKVPRAPRLCAPAPHTRRPGRPNPRKADYSKHSFPSAAPTLVVMRREAALAARGAAPSAHSACPLASWPPPPTPAPLFGTPHTHTHLDPGLPAPTAHSASKRQAATAKTAPRRPGLNQGLLGARGAEGRPAPRKGVTPLVMNRRYTAPDSSAASKGLSARGGGGGGIGARRAPRAACGRRRRSPRAPPMGGALAPGRAAAAARAGAPCGCAVGGPGVLSRSQELNQNFAARCRGAAANGRAASAVRGAAGRRRRPELGSSTTCGRLRASRDRHRIWGCHRQHWQSQELDRDCAVRRHANRVHLRRPSKEEKRGVVCPSHRLLTTRPLTASRGSCCGLGRRGARRRDTQSEGAPPQTRAAPAPAPTRRPAPGRPARAIFAAAPNHPSFGPHLERH